MICERHETLVLRRDVYSLCVLYRIYHEVYSEELFDLLPATKLPTHTLRHKLKHHPHHLDTLHFTIVRLLRNFLPHATQLSY